MFCMHPGAGFSAPVVLLLLCLIFCLSPGSWFFRPVDFLAASSQGAGFSAIVVHSAACGVVA